MKVRKSKVNLLLVIFGASLFLNACCFRDGDVIDSYSLTEDERSIMPYQNDSLVQFRHSGGYLFTSQVTTSTFITGDQEHCEDYYVYENYTINVTSELPRLNMEFGLSSAFSNEDAILWVTVDRTPFFEITPSPTPSLVIEGVIFDEVKTYMTDDGDFYIQEILYNTTSGILRINYKDETYAELVP